MPLRDSLSVRGELFFASACLAAHAYCVLDSPEAAFRQRDVKFMVELFSNWVQNHGENGSMPVKNTQVGRYLETLSQEGYARPLRATSRPAYRLTRIGLIELLSRIVNRTYYPEREQFLFLFYFIKNYRDVFIRLVETEGRQFPPALRIELEALLDKQSLLKKERDHAALQLKKLEVRINDAHETAKLSASMAAAGKDIGEIVKAVQREYPYELNSQKPLTELVLGLPVQHRLRELKEATIYRAKEIWEPAREMLKLYLALLEKLGRETD